MNDEKRDKNEKGKNSLGMPRERAHALEKQERTQDVITEDSITFKELLLSEKTLAGLEAAGFKKPSPIQRKAIPLGRCGFDLIVQAKSGTGKTCVFTIVALEMVNTELDRLQVLMLSPTREISVQIKDVIKAIGQGFKGLKVKAFIGGLPLETDKKNLQKCQIAVGAPGRVKHLISQGLMKVDAVRLFVLDEADKLMEESFRSDISYIFLKLPKTKQTIASSATYPPTLEEFISRYTNSPTRISLGHGIFLKGIRQFVSIVPRHANLLNQTRIKEAELLRILSNVSFKQCLIFSNYQSRVEGLCNKLKKEGFPAVYISGSQTQSARLQSITNLKEFACRVFVSTDLTSRGIDAENVNLVLNLDVPYDSSTYMHRIGRAGRYGTQGLAITVVETGSECDRFKKMLCEIGGRNFEIPILPRGKLKEDIWKMKGDEFEKMSVVEEEKEEEVTSEIKGKKVGKDVADSRWKNDNDLVESVKKEKSLFVDFMEECLKPAEKLQLKSFDELCELEREFSGLQFEDKTEKLKDEKINDVEYSEKISSFLGGIEKEDFKQFKMKLMNGNEDLSEPTKNGEFPDGKKELVEKELENICRGEDEREDETSSFQSCHSEGEEKSDEETETSEEDESDSSSDLEYDDERYTSEDTSTIGGSFEEEWYAAWQAQARTVNEYVDYVRNFHRAAFHPFAYNFCT